VPFGGTEEDKKGDFLAENMLLKMLGQYPEKNG
jgi:hypothetical protein